MHMPDFILYGVPEKTIEIAERIFKTVRAWLGRRLDEFCTSMNEQE